jgi:hypothetical protein
VGVIADPSFLGHQPQAVLDRRGEDQSIGGVGWEGARKVGGGVGDRGADPNRSQPSHYAGADEPSLRNSAWLEAQWEEGRRLARSRPGGATLAIDEVQKATGWAETAKRLRDEDRRSGLPLRVVPGPSGRDPLLAPPRQGGRLRRRARQAADGDRGEERAAPGRTLGMAAFEEAYGPVRKLLVGGDGTPLEDVLGGDAIGAA